MANGAIIAYHGHAELDLRIMGWAPRLKATFIECDVGRPVLSVSELGAHGHELVFNSSGCECKLHGKAVVPTSRCGR